MLSEIQLKRNFNTDKESRHKYLSNFYDKALLKYQNKNVKLLEIGVNTCGSLALWDKYFKDSIIFGIDINISRCTINSSENNNCINLKECDAYKLNPIEFFEDKFDIIIDDGSHEYNDQIYVIKEYSKVLNSEGILIIEDIQSVSLANRIQNMFKGEVINLTPLSGVDDSILFVLYN